MQAEIDAACESVDFLRFNVKYDELLLFCSFGFWFLVLFRLHSCVRVYSLCREAEKIFAMQPISSPGKLLHLFVSFSFSFLLVFNFVEVI
jgi:hypothetical protein